MANAETAIGSREETRLYFEAVELAEAVTKAAAVLASACPSSRASGSTNATLARGLRLPPGEPLSGSRRFACGRW